VTDLPGVYTYHNDLGRTGANDREYALKTSSVNTDSFGKLCSCFVDGVIYTQPLWVANLRINGRPHNAVFVGTEHDSLYAFDADAAPCSRLWRVNLIDVAHGGRGGEKPVSGKLVGRGDGDLVPEVGITGTPVVDPANSLLYVVSKSVSSSGTRFYHRLHAIDLATGDIAWQVPLGDAPQLAARGITGTGTYGVPINPGMEQTTTYSGTLNNDGSFTSTRAEGYGFGLGGTGVGAVTTQTISISVSNETLDAIGSAFSAVANYLGLSGPQTSTGPPGSEIGGPIPTD